jgi:hypothetical protein
LTGYAIENCGLDGFEDDGPCVFAVVEFVDGIQVLARSGKDNDGVAILS